MSYCVFFSLLVVSLTKYFNSPSPLHIILELFSVKKMKPYVYKANVFIDGQTNIFKVYYKIFARGLIVSFFSKTQKKICDGKKEKISITTFKKWPFMNDSRIETEDGQVLSALCRYCSDMEYNDIMRDARSSFLHWQSFRRSLEIRMQMTNSTVQLLKKCILLYEVITSIAIGYCNMSRFTSLSGNGREARKTVVEAKELVFLKLLAKGFSGYISLFIIEVLHILSRHLCSNF